jgi:hypothetical protein
MTLQQKIYWNGLKLQAARREGDVSLIADLAFEAVKLDREAAALATDSASGVKSPLESDPVGD